MTRLSSKKGFSLMEVMIVLLITGLVMGCVAGLTRETMITLKFLQEKSKTLQSATLGLERLASELSEAVGDSTSVTTGNPVSFFKVPPQAIEAVGNDRDDPNDPSDTFDPSNTWVRVYPDPVEVVYEEVDGTLSRTAAGQTSVVASDVVDFDVQRFNSRPDTFEVRLSIKEQRRVITFRTLTIAPGLTR
jgi:prepilin-type N-terminal cleavage/methylation domain-containing protein